MWRRPWWRWRWWWTQVRSKPACTRFTFVFDCTSNRALLENFQVAGFQTWLFYFLPLQFSILWFVCMIFHPICKTSNNDEANEWEKVSRLLIQSTISDWKVYLSKNYLANIIIECLNFTTKPPKIWWSKTSSTCRFSENNKQEEYAGL